VVPDRAPHLALHPDDGVKLLADGAAAGDRTHESPYVLRPFGKPNPRQPGVEVSAVALDRLVDGLGVFLPHQADLDAGRHDALKHHSTTAKARTGNVPNAFTLTGTA
jgi:hypothetical protein